MRSAGPPARPENESQCQKDASLRLLDSVFLHTRVCRVSSSTRGSVGCLPPHAGLSGVFLHTRVCRVSSSTRGSVGCLPPHAGLSGVFLHTRVCRVSSSTRGSVGCLLKSSVNNVNISKKTTNVFKTCFVQFLWSPTFAPKDKRLTQ